MEMRGKIFSSIARSVFILLAMLFAAASDAQHLKDYTIRNGRMMITLGKDLPDADLKEFVKQFDLNNLALDRFIKLGFDDSIRKQGWKIDIDNSEIIVISKSLQS